MVHLALSLLVACSGDTTTPLPTDVSQTTPTGDTGGGGTTHSATATHSGGGTHTGAPTHSATTPTGDTGTTTTHTGVVDLESLVPGTWRPTAVDGTPVPDNPRNYKIFDASGTLTLGCGRPATGTWTWQAKAPAPAIGILDVQLGAVPVSWYVLSLDQQNLVFVEGGDVFEHDRATCPP